MEFPKTLLNLLKVPRYPILASIGYLAKIRAMPILATHRSPVGHTSLSLALFLK